MFFRLVRRVCQVHGLHVAIGGACGKVGVVSDVYWVPSMLVLCVACRLPCEPFAPQLGVAVPAAQRVCINVCVQRIAAGSWFDVLCDAQSCLCPVGGGRIAARSGE